MNKINDILQTMEYGLAPESDDIARQWLAECDGKIGHFINGKFSKPGAKSFQDISPIDGKKIASVALGTKADVNNAANAAKKALLSWSHTSGHERARVLYALARLVQKHSRLLAVMETIDNGKPIRETRDIDIPLVARHFYHHAGWAQLAESQFPDMQGVGVCGQVIPWNFPLLMLAWKVAPALAAGCTIVLKPAEYTPLTAMIFAQLCNEAGLPKGVFNIVNGDGSTGAAITEHKAFDKIAFTGSSDVGRIIRRATAGSGKKLSLELGGKSPFIIFDNADIDAAVEGIVDAIWFNQGEVCCAGSRALVQEGIADQFYAKLTARMEQLRVGNPLDKNIDMGSVVHPTQLENIRQRVEEGIKSGAQIWQPEWAVDNKGFVGGASMSGCYYPPTLFTNVQPASLLAQEEVFGPVLAAMTFRTPDEAIALANDSKFGLSASIWSQNLDIAFDTAKNVHAGIVWINSTNMFDASAGFGGYKESGFGREGGREGMIEYLVPAWQKSASKISGSNKLPKPLPTGEAGDSTLDRTAKFYIGGKQARPDSGYSFPVHDHNGQLISHMGVGNRKDIRNAVEAAHKAGAWAQMTGHQRAQVLYFLAENLEVRRAEITSRLIELTGTSAKLATREFDASINRIFHYAAWADKYDGDVRSPQANMLVLSLKETWLVMGISCPDEAPLLSFLSLVLPAIAMGNCVVVTPSPAYPLIATDLYQVFDTSDIPGGVINIVIGDRNELADTIAKHDDIAAHWYFGCETGSAMVERESAGNLKATWVNNGKSRDWFNNQQGAGEEFLFHAVRFKNIWTPFGV
ncbi:MAG: aldehyde dehydrogenase family protein [Hyphomicrobiales bacterium]|nr:aldehyde dehydrogenase family protein [Hyphomicrobiales bacterium]